MNLTQNEQKTVSVAQAAALCGVSHGTIGYWIRTKKLHAYRTGRNYTVPVDEVSFFLRSRGRNIPPELMEDTFQMPLFRNSQKCWQYWQEKDHGSCSECVVFLNQLDDCFTAKISSRLGCKCACGECRYFLETYLPRVQFIQQIDLPAAIYKGLHLWGGNRRWAALCNVPVKDIPGMGVEQVFDADSLETVISNVKKGSLGDPDAARTYDACLKNDGRGKLHTQISVYPLNEPSGAFLVLAKPEGKKANP